MSQFVRVAQIVLEEDGDGADGQRRVRGQRQHDERGRRGAPHPAVDRRGLRAPRAPAPALLQGLLRRPQGQAEVTVRTCHIDRPAPTPVPD